MLRRTIAYTIFGVTCLAMLGCSQTNPHAHAQDPFEGLNRATFGFNKTIDKVIAKPVSYVYLKYLPQPLQTGIGNFFDNLREITNVANDLLQFNFGYAAYDTSRFLINSTVGIGGLFDPASSLGLEHRKEDFGLTLYHWGYKNSTYLILPFLGPSTVRDTIGLAVDYYGFSIWPWIHNDWKKYALLGVDYIDFRAALLRKESVLDVLAVDEYAFMRDAYLQHRLYLFNGASNEAEEEEDPYAGVDMQGQHVAKDKKEVTPKKVETKKVASEVKKDPEDGPAKPIDKNKHDTKAKVTQTKETVSIPPITQNPQLQSPNI